MINEFIKYYSGLSEKEKFAIGKEFKKQTGGTLSIYDTPIPVVVGLITFNINNEIKLLGIKRAEPPHVGGIALPGGFIDKGEDPFMAIKREIQEETGIETNCDDYEFFGKPLISPNNHLLIFLKNKKIYNEESILNLRLNAEVSAFKFIDINTNICFPLHKEKCIDFFTIYLQQKNNVLKVRHGLK